jgi:hypothetical protein
MRSRNMFAAVIGPIVCELEGPMPILKTSNTERNITTALLPALEISQTIIDRTASRAETPPEADIRATSPRPRYFI